MATVSLVAARKGGAYYVHDGLVVIGFAGNGEDGSKWWCKDFDQVKCSVARVSPSVLRVLTCVQAADWMVYMAERGSPQAKYVEASEAERGMEYRNLTATDTEWSNTLAEQAWDLLAPKVGLFMGSLHTCSCSMGSRSSQSQALSFSASLEGLRR